jgi:probable HAF family extracellular repeat protein
VGSIIFKGEGPHAFITGPKGVGTTDLGTVGGHLSFALGINDIGQVVGWSTTAADSWQAHAFIAGPNDVGMTDLGTWGGWTSAAYGINDEGQVVGWSSTATGEQHAFITGPNGVGMTDLGTLGGWASAAYGINDAGQVVGSSYTATGPPGGYLHAFITGPNGVGMTDLNSLIELPTGIALEGALAINNVGQVIVYGPIPEPQSYALMLAGLILVGFVFRRKRLLA